MTAAVRWALVVMSATALWLRFFTYECHLQDDPTVRLVLRAVPSLRSRQAVESFSDAPYLLQDENGFVGYSLYRFNVEGGWLLFAGLLVGVAAWTWRARRARASGDGRTS